MTKRQLGKLSLSLLDGLNPSSPFSGGELIAIMTWPLDESKRKQFLAAFGADIIGFNEHALCSDNPFIHIDKQNLFMRLDVSRQQRAAGLSHSNMIEIITKQLYAPAGGLNSVIHAPPYHSMLNEWKSASTGPPGRAGASLSVLAVLKVKHPNIPATLNRAYAVVERHGEIRGGHRSSERYLKEAWRDWAWISPLWAALWLEITFARERNLLGWPLAYYQGRKRLLETARWFRHFAVSHVSQGAARTLMEDLETIYIPGSGEPAMPALPTLNSELAEAAQKYTVKAVRQ